MKLSRAKILVAIFGVGAVLKLFTGAEAPKLPPVPIAKALAKFPSGLAGEQWKETRSALDEHTLEIAGVSDYLQRFYDNGRQSFWFYVGYVSQWNTSAIHHPEVCFPGQGLDLENTSKIAINVPELAEKHPKGSIRFNELLWKDQLGNPIYTLYTFYFDGNFEPSESKMRAKNTIGIHYFSIITISGPVNKDAIDVGKERLQGALKRFLPELVTHFPDLEKLKADKTKENADQ